MDMFHDNPLLQGVRQMLGAMVLLGEEALEPGHPVEKWYRDEDLRHLRGHRADPAPHHRPSPHRPEPDVARVRCLGRRRDAGLAGGYLTSNLPLRPPKPSGASLGENGSLIHWPSATNLYW